VRLLEQETNPDVLREFAILMRDEIKRAHAKIDELRSTRETEALSKQQRIDLILNEKLNRLRRKYYGFGRESIEKDENARPVGHLGQNLLVHGDRPRDHGETSAKKQGVPNHENPLAEIYNFLDETLMDESKSRGVAAGAEAWSKMDSFYQESTEVTITERVYQKVVHKQQKYRLKDEYNTTGKEVIITAPGPAKLQPGCQYSIDFAIQVVIDKYEYHLPLERQSRQMEEAGLSVDTKTLYNLAQSVAEHAETVTPKIKSEIKNDYCAVHLDETPWRLLKDKKLGYFWVMSNRLGTYYQFEPSRSGKIPVEILKGYDGAVVCDAYGGYNATKRSGIRMQNCLAHARREFYERYDDYPDDCQAVIEVMDRIFAIEREAKTIEELRVLRNEKSKPEVATLKKLLFEIAPKYLKEEGISKAIQYTLNHWAGLTHFLSDLTVPLTNNDAERALRHLVVGRKNFLGSQTINGADTAATLYTVIETCKRNGLHPKEYLKYLIQMRWLGKEADSPKEFADKKFPPGKVKFPARSDWQA
jgi:transposase